MATLTPTLTLVSTDATSDSLNLSVTDSLEIEKADAGDEFMSLAPGEFAFFPWDGTLDMFADATANTPVLEVMIFEATA